MLIGTIRPDETRTSPVQGEELDEIQPLVAAQTPAGWEIVEAPVAMSKKDTILTCEATIARRDGLQEIEGSRRPQADRGPRCLSRARSGPSPTVRWRILPIVQRVVAQSAP